MLIKILKLYSVLNVQIVLYEIGLKTMEKKGLDKKLYPINPL